jgi:hypothetical protein
MRVLDERQEKDRSTAAAGLEQDGKNHRERSRQGKEASPLTTGDDLGGHDLASRPLPRNTRRGVPVHEAKEPGLMVNGGMED